MKGLMELLKAQDEYTNEVAKGVLQLQEQFLILSKLTTTLAIELKKLKDKEENAKA